MVKRILFQGIILFFCFYFLILFEVSFLAHFRNLNLILILIILINLFEKPKENFGVLAALFGGFFKDIFSPGLIGFQILIFLFLSLLIKYFFKRYVQFF